MTATPENPLRLFLIRHGETAWSLSGQHTGSTDIPLTAHGETEAEALAPLLGQIQFVHVLTSPMQRARRTCELGGLGGDAIDEPDLAEWNYGDYEGERSCDIHRTRPGWNVFRDGCPNGETPQQVSDRADRLIARLRTIQGNVALFSHGHFGPALATRWVELPIVAGRHFPLNTASLNILSYSPAHPDVPVISLWNATAKLFQAKSADA
ncbi:histidine phosphatase family protein [Pseudorhodobacter sp.]|uniref:histidine phosphatase family protein n=1 Tax=Pseudorhodobacter sp. TaxID=1934400 RepID=UPI0026498467|nr:histidine phosphatase family protein [Pseudorhodobacter sp.]MDN5787252.1 histidine phosphatase family protein [Pseudorhodobacter sp.]